MIEFFKQTVGWKILSNFFENPTKTYYVKELARNIKISPGSVSRLCARLANQKFLEKEKKGKMIFYRLNNENLLIKQLKAIYFLFKLFELNFIERILDIDPNIVSLAIYGSYANGEYDEKSDLDVLIISHISKKQFHHVVSTLEKGTGIEILPTILTLNKWANLSEKKDEFYLEVLSNHILLYGSSLVI